MLISSMKKKTLDSRSQTIRWRQEKVVIKKKSEQVDVEKLLTDNDRSAQSPSEVLDV